MKNVSSSHHLKLRETWNKDYKTAPEPPYTTQTPAHLPLLCSELTRYSSPHFTGRWPPASQGSDGEALFTVLDEYCDTAPCTLQKKVFPPYPLPACLTSKLSYLISSNEFMFR